MWHQPVMLGRVARINLIRSYIKLAESRLRESEISNHGEDDGTVEQARLYP
jgi:hypothetical protein